MKRLSVRTISALLLTMTFLFTGCSSECEKCDAAIQHMWEKIEQQFCNTNSMQEAADRIREDCKDVGGNPELYIKLMAESCCEDRLILPICEVTNGMTVELWFYHWTNDPGGLPVDAGMWVEIPGLSDERFRTTPSAGYVRIIKEFDLPEGKVLTFNFYNLENDIQPALTSTQTLTFLRNSGFNCATREVTLHWHLATDDYTVEYFDWD